MTEKITILILSLIFLGTFIARNLIVKAKIKNRIRASDPLLTTSIILTTLCIVGTILSTFSNRFYQLLGALSFLRTPWVSYLGLFLLAASIIMGWFFSSQLKESWRVGIHQDQKTKLIQSGIYKYIRNPYFLSYFIMFMSLFLVRPSLIMVVLITFTIAIFHRMVLNEEVHLASIHGEAYERYKETTGRYMPRCYSR